ncbi:MAG TPA: LLM class F420-dependent oxidoreductase [Dehalococcoidia bacterium]|nr:LLM class F420-dependent oxidoreductase [Dehalococcoidia bacterium]
MDIGRVGIWTFQLDGVPAAESQRLAGEIEDMGYGAVWLPEAVGRDVLVNSALILGGTKRIVVGTGIASIWARDAVTTAAAHKTLTEAYPDRFLLGLGASHYHLVQHLRGHLYEKPYSYMSEYLDKMDAAPFMAAQPTTEPRRVLAALGPKMLKLAAEKAMGAHPYFVPVEHTAFARKTMGKGPLLAVEQAVVLETDAEKARTMARGHMAVYLRAPNYTNNLKRMGFDDSDLVDGGSDRLVDAIVAWGDIGKIVDRVRAHHEAGADHVCVQVVTEDPRRIATPEWKALAKALL